MCELAVQPDTYEALAEIFDSYAPLPENYMSDEDIEGAYWVVVKLYIACINMYVCS